MENTGTAAGWGMIGLVYVVILVGMIAGIWKTFAKAGQPGWAAIVPIYNIVVMLRIAGKPLWWILLMLVPFVNFVILILMCVGIAKAFGKGAGYGLGLLILGFIFFPMLGFGDATYKAPAAA